jgi:hypothetical protein
MYSDAVSFKVVIPILLAMEAYRNAEVCEKGVEFDSSVILGKITSLTIFVYYSFSIIPDTYANFFNVVGAADSVYSRLLSLRRELWLQADDSLLQMIGYKIDIYMNTSYETLLSSKFCKNGIAIGHSLSLQIDQTDSLTCPPFYHSSEYICHFKY